MRAGTDWAEKEIYSVFLIPGHPLIEVLLCLHRESACMRGIEFCNAAGEGAATCKTSREKIEEGTRKVEGRARKETTTTNTSEGGDCQWIVC